MRNVTKRLAQVALVAVLAVPTMGCPQALPAVAEIITVIADAGQWLDIISTAAKFFFMMRPNPTLEQEFGARVVRARLALNAALRATHGVQALSQSDVDKAFADFRDAYKELLDLAQQIGVVAVDGTVAVGVGTAAPVRVPVLLTEHVRIR